MTNKAKIIGTVKIGKGAILEDGVIIASGGSGVTVIGKNAHLRSNTNICSGVKIGDNFETGPGVFIREDNKIGNNVCIWAYTVLNPGNKIGNNTRIHAGCFLEKVTLGEFVFVAPHVTFTDDPHPANPPRRTCMGGAVVEDGAIIGANVTLLPHVIVGRKSIIGAGSVVTKEVKAGKVVVGNPAKETKDTFDIECIIKGEVHYPYR